MPYLRRRRFVGESLGGRPSQPVWCNGIPGVLCAVDAADMTACEGHPTKPSYGKWPLRGQGPADPDGRESRIRDASGDDLRPSKPKINFTLFSIFPRKQGFPDRGPRLTEPLIFRTIRPH